MLQTLRMYCVRHFITAAYATFRHLNANETLLQVYKLQGMMFAH